MRRILALLALPSMVVLLAQEAAQKIVFFMPGQVISTSVRAKKVLAELEVTTKTLNDKLKVKVDELQKLEQQLKSPGLSDEGRAKLQRDLQDGELVARRLQEDSQAELRKVQEKCLGQFQNEVRPIIEALAKEIKATYVLNFQDGMLSYADEAVLMQFSTEVAKRYDQKYEGGASAEKPAPKPAPKPAAGKK